MEKLFDSSDRTRSITTLSSSSHSSLPPIPSGASINPISSSMPEISSPFSRTSSKQQTPAEDCTLSLTSIHAQWIQALDQYTDFHLHAALSTFKRLLRDLRTTVNDASSPTISVHGQIESTPYRILLPEEIALLYTNIALIHGYLGSYYLAAAAFEEALLVDDMLGLAWFGLGISRFYLRELSASRRAFGKCQNCFALPDEDGRKYQREELDYKIWAGHSAAGSERDNTKDAEDSDDAPDPWHEFKGILARSFPGGVWKLAKTRVEWNWRIALFERNYLRKGVERPDGGRWGLHGIPAGVIFGPNSVPGKEAIAIHDFAVGKAVTEAPGLGMTAARGFAAGLKGRSGSLVRDKWSHLQQKLLGKKLDAATRSHLTGRTQSAASTAFSSDSKHDSMMPMRVVNDPIKASSRWLPRPPAGILKKSVLPTPALTLSHIRNPFTDELEEVDGQYQISRTKPLHVPMPSLFPPRRSSLTLQSTRSPLPQRRSSRGSFLVASATAGDIGKIEEEPDERKSIVSSSLPLYTDSADQDLDEPSDPDRPSSSRSSDLSPKSFAANKWTDDIMLPNLMLDLAPSAATLPGDMPGTASSSLRGSESSAVDGISPQSLETGKLIRTVLAPVFTSFHDPMSGSQYGHGSFMTDNISPLSSQMRSAMFPRFPDQCSGSLRHPSWPSGVWEASPDTANSKYNDQYSRRPSAIVTLTPATPERRSEQRPATATILDDLIDNHNFGSTFDPPYSPYPPDLEADLNDEDMAVAPLDIKKERMSITGRTCLGEWEWEEQYRQWKQEDSAGTDGEDDAMVGEMLLPRRYEG
ncbi:MAG: hypothetical protein LQ346_004371 [Caloplaca aetnensis]|nr:MAG: hypothetical protein LQ346_004371 [Caloplaca aetnensis]